MEFRRLKASTKTIPIHMRANPFRIVLLELNYGKRIGYATSEEIIDSDPTQATWLCYIETTNDYPLKRFEERLSENKVVVDEEFKEELEWSKWV